MALPPYFRPLLILITPAISLLFSGFALAADPPTSSRPLFANPGDFVFDFFTITNQTNTPIDYQTDVVEGIAQQTTITPTLPDDFLKNTDSIALHKWITVEPNRFTLPAHQSRKLGITIKVPKEAESGTHFAVVRGYKTGHDQVLPADVVFAQPFTLSLPGELREHLDISQVESGSAYSNQDQALIRITTKNTGNIHLVASGSLVITSGNNVITKTTISPFIILPNSSRKLPVTLPIPLRTGKYVAKLHLNYGSTSQPADLSSAFTVYPNFDNRLAFLLAIPAIAAIVLIERSLRKKRAPRG
jgi:hypothetical protein